MSWPAEPRPDGDPGGGHRGRAGRHELEHGLLHGDPRDVGEHHWKISVVRARRLQLEDLILLDQLGASSIDSEIEESDPSCDDDHLSTRGSFENSSESTLGQAKLAALEVSRPQRDAGVQGACRSASIFKCDSPESIAFCNDFAIERRSSRTGRPSHDSADLTIVLPSCCSSRWTWIALMPNVVPVHSMR